MLRIKIAKCTFIILSIIGSVSAQAVVFPGHVSGKITNITSTTRGILVRIEENEVPENCQSGYKWMEIDQNYTAMISMTLTAWTLGRKVNVYTEPTEEGYCNIKQVDPFES